MTTNTTISHADEQCVNILTKMTSSLPVSHADEQHVEDDDAQDGGVKPAVVHHLKAHTARQTQRPVRHQHVARLTGAFLCICALF